MSINEESSEKLYSQAYNLHYNANDMDAALAVYNRIIELYPESEDAQSAKFQISQISKTQQPDLASAQDGATEGFSDTKQIAAPTRSHYSSYQKATSATGGSFWVSGMRVFAWILFIAIIIIGIALAVLSDSGGLGFLIVLGSIIAAFLSVAILMIFLDLAQDVSRIKCDISEMKNIIQGKK